MLSGVLEQVKGIPEYSSWEVSVRHRVGRRSESSQAR